MTSFLRYFVVQIQIGSQLLFDGNLIKKSYFSDVNIEFMES